MTKNTMRTIYAYLNGDTSVDIETARQALNEEIEKADAKAKANRVIYDTAHAVVIQTLQNDGPMTISDLWSKVESLVPEGFTRAKMQYALLHYWENEVERTQNTEVDGFVYSAR